MPSIIDRNLNLNYEAIPLGDSIVIEASFYISTPYRFGSKEGTINDNKPLDCSRFVINVLRKIKPQLTIPDLGSAGLKASTLFNTIDLKTQSPAKSDLIYWSHGHVGFVVDTFKGNFIGSQTRTGVAVSKYKSGYWSTISEKTFLRLKP